MAKYSFRIDKNLIKSRKIVIDAPNPNVANNYFVNLLRKQGIIHRQNYNMPNELFKGTDKEGKPFKNEFVPYKDKEFAKKLNKDIKSYFNRNYTNRRRELKEVLSDGDSGNSFNM
jgi:hypothetical protein